MHMLYRILQNAYHLVEVQLLEAVSGDPGAAKIQLNLTIPVQLLLTPNICQ